MKKIKKEIKVIILFIWLIIVLITYGKLLKKQISIRNFVNHNIEIYEKNKENVFEISNIVLYSSANAIDESENHNLQELKVYQYTDIAIKINNGEELTNKNTVKQLYIDNISFDGNSNIGTKSLNYKNALKFALNQEISEKNIISNERIDFNVIHTNEENQKANYNEPSFYTDCSNPITLQYINNNLTTGYKITQNNSIAFDGSILKDSGINIDDIKGKVKFKINIINNDNEQYSCWVNLDIPLEGVYRGNSKEYKTVSGNKYRFFRG